MGWQQCPSDLLSHSSASLLGPSQVQAFRLLLLKNPQITLTPSPSLNPENVLPVSSPPILLTLLPKGCGAPTLGPACSSRPALQIPNSPPLWMGALSLKELRQPAFLWGPPPRRLCLIALTRALQLAQHQQAGIDTDFSLCFLTTRCTPIVSGQNSQTFGGSPPPSRGGHNSLPAALN